LKKKSEQPLVPVRITKGNVFSIARSAYKDKGLYYFIGTIPKYLLEICIKRIPNYLSFLYYKWYNSSKTFEFQGNAYNYLFHTYCSTWKNERCAVIPIAWKVIQAYQGQKKNILEIGNVTSYFYHIEHDVLDKYEIADDVINEDVADFQTSKKYDLIFSIVTLQCVGWNESTRNPRKILRVIEKLKSLLALNGLIMVIHGIGENKYMDELLRNGELKFNKKYYLKRVSDFRWEETDWDSIKELKYDYSIPTANGVVIGIIENNHHAGKLFKLF
jgi:hypothetical protein